MKPESGDKQPMAASAHPVPVSLIKRLACEVFDDETYAETWLNERNIALNGRSPSEVIMSDPEGVEIVRALLLRIQYGVLA
jgi:uncharacterized protein (DUF2384 family)